ncbi:MAG: Crp/Fnr family transcriptional regulator [Flaviramulus sp.]|nr:Crp/Fnr family transcriptional regulator [Flaviramulus sp.]
MKESNSILNLLSGFSHEKVNQLIELADYRKIESGIQLVKLGEVPTKVYFVISGVVRCYICTESGKEFNKNFYLPNSFLGSLTALITKKPSNLVFETLTSCKLYEIDFNKLMQMCKKSHELSLLYSSILEYIYIKYEKRLVELISLDAKDRYLELKSQIPDLDNLIPQYHIASYLGITAVQLSRIRKKLDSD